MPSCWDNKTEILLGKAIYSLCKIPQTEEMKIMFPLTLRMCGRASLVRANGAKKLTVNKFCANSSEVAATGCSISVYPALLIRTSSPRKTCDHLRSYKSTVQYCESGTLTSKLVDGLLNDGRARFQV